MVACFCGGFFIFELILISLVCNVDYEVYPASVTETNVAFVTLHRQFDLQGIH
mgnify:CR=1 FL=1